MRGPSRLLNFEKLESREPLTAAYLMFDGDATASGHVTANVMWPADASVRAAEVHLEFDPKQLDIEAADIRTGDIWSRPSSLLANIDEQAGKIVVFAFSIQEQQSAGGSLLQLHFTTIDDTSPQLPAVSLTAVRLDERPVDIRSSLAESATADAESLVEGESDGRPPVGPLDVTPAPLLPAPPAPTPPSPSPTSTAKPTPPPAKPSPAPTKSPLPMPAPAPVRTTPTAQTSPSTVRTGGPLPPATETPGTDTFLPLPKDPADWLFANTDDWMSGERGARRRLAR